MTQPDGITPDTKDWTWVLDRRCPECGYAAATMDPLAIGGAVRASLPRWREALEREDARVRQHPSKWSTLEYSAHVRDVFRIFDRRLSLMLTQNDPLFDNWDQDATAIEDRYAEQDPVTVTAELVEAGEQIAARFDAVTPEELSRTGRRSDGASFTVESFGRYFLHDVVHHLYDINA